MRIGEGGIDRIAPRGGEREEQGLAEVSGQSPALRQGALELWKIRAG